MAGGVITMLTDAIARDFARLYAPHGGGWRRLGGGAGEVITDDAFTDDVRAWLEELDAEGGANIVARARELTASNDGWPVILARRAMARLRARTVIPEQDETA